MSTYQDMVDFLKYMYPARKYIVPCLCGPVGIGKTAAVMQHAEEVGAKKVVTIIASQILPNEVSGITMPVPETKAMEIFDHYRLSSLEDGDILFFDELLEADQLVLSACLTLIESRQMMSGRKLPDVQIIAATNPTIKPNMLKESIRQRFLFRKFDLDPDGCCEYIGKLVGFDVSKLKNSIRVTGDEYNILTPRLLTKMCQLVADTQIDMLDEVASQIDSVWGCALGTEIVKCRRASLISPMIQVRDAVRSSLRRHDVTKTYLDASFGEGAGDFLNDDDSFTETTLAEIMNLIQQLPDWEQIKGDLEKQMLTEQDKVDKIAF